MQLLNKIYNYFSIIILIIIILFLGISVFTNTHSDYVIDDNNDLYVTKIYNQTPFQYAFDFYGETETYGTRSNTRILYLFDTIADWVTDDEVPWCSAFMNHVHLATGYKYTGKLNARSWLTYGESVTRPLPGDIAILWRENIKSWKGHVGFFIRFNHDKSKVLLYGGNQNNKAGFKWYPTSRILDYRMSERIHTYVYEGDLLEDNSYFQDSLLVLNFSNN